MNRRKLVISLGAIAVVVVGGFFGVRQLSGASTSTTANLQTAQIERGTLVAGVSAAGSITALETATLAWQTTGVVGQVNVQVGDTVNRGEALLELDPASLNHTVIQAQADLIAAQEELDTLMGGPTALQLAQAEVKVVDAQAAVKTAQRSLDNVLSPDLANYQDQYRLAQEALTAAQQNSEITAYGTSLKAAQDALTAALNNLKKYQDLESQYPGYGQQHGNALVNAQAAYDKAAQDYQVALYKYQQSQASDANTLAAAQETLDTAQANLAAAQSTPNAASAAYYQAQFDLAQANLAQAQADLAQLQAGPTSKDLTAAKAKVAAAQAIVDTARQVAPFNGTVVAVNNRVGDSVSSGETAVVLADLSSLEIEVSVSEVDINRVAVGQAVSLTADAASGLTFKGQVAAVAVLGQSQQGVVTFPVTVVIPDPDPELKPGMTAAVSIVTESHANVLLVPNRAIRVSSGQRSVTVLFEGQQISVPVTIGLSNESLSEIASGQVREGDTVVINSTTTTTTNQAGGGLFGIFGGGGGQFRP